MSTVLAVFGQCDFFESWRQVLPVPALGMSLPPLTFNFSRPLPGYVCMAYRPCPMSHGPWPMAHGLWPMAYGLRHGLWPTAWPMAYGMAYDLRPIAYGRAYGLSAYRPIGLSAYRPMTYSVADGL